MPLYPALAHILQFRWEQFKGFTSANSRSHQVWPNFLKLQRGLQK